MQTAVRVLGASFVVWTAVACSPESHETSIDAPPPEVDLQVTLGAKIATVAFAECETSLARDEVLSAEVHYALEDGNGELVAPIDLSQDRVAGAKRLTFRTALLGMKQHSMYSVHVELETESGTVSSDQTTVQTGPLPTLTPRVVVDDTNAAKLYGGFTVACTGPGAGEPWAYIWDRDGDVVWAHTLADAGLDACTRARLSYDGRELWVGDLNLGGGGGALARLDVTGEREVVTLSLPGRHHDFAILPNGKILYFKEEKSDTAQPGSERDVIYELDPASGESTKLYDELDDFGAVIGETPAHTNYIAFVPHLNAISFSMLTANTIGLVSYPEGKLLATFGGAASDFDMMWRKQHGHQVLEDEFLVFSNQGAGLTSMVFAYRLDLEASTSEPRAQYESDDSTPTFGDVQRLPNGNYLITYSNAGAIHELANDWKLLRRTETVGIGYVEHRRSLYGPPPPFAD